jgi:hypothetical protein
MLSQAFEEPITVWVGLGFPRKLNSGVDAYQFANEYCGNSPEQRAAIRACKAALSGEIDAETAKGVFVAFARKKGLMADDWVPPPIKSERHRSLR